MRPVSDWRRSAVDKRLIQESAQDKVNLIQRLFGRHPHPEGMPPTSCNWTGQSSRVYHYDIYSFDAVFRPLAGNYIYARQREDGSWEPIYISQTRDLHQRLEGHVRLEDAIANGATHLHAHYGTSGQAARCSEEHDLVQRWRPVCNEAPES